MKGLIKKDLYMMKNYCKMYILIVLCLFISMIFSSDNSIAFSYVYMIASMIVITLMSYDENNGLIEYSNELPIKASTLVSSKYLIGFAINISILLFNIVLVLVVKKHIDIELISTCIAIACTSFSITIPVYFRFGVQKGRIAYYLMIGIVFGFGIYSSTLTNSFKLGSVNSILLVCISLMILVISWLLSIRLFKTRLKKLR